METPEDCNNIISHVSEVGGHLRMDHAVLVVPDFLDNSFDGAGCLLDLDLSPVMGRVDFLKVKQVHSRLINRRNLNCLSLPRRLRTFLSLSLPWVVLGLHQ